MVSTVGDIAFAWTASLLKEKWTALTPTGKDEGRGSEGNRGAFRSRC